MNRKLLFIFFIFSFFLFGYTVKASDEVIVPYDNSFKRFKNQDFMLNYGGTDIGNVENQMKELISVLKQNGVNYIITSSIDGLSSYHFSGISIKEYSTSNLDLNVTKEKGSSNYYSVKFESQQQTVSTLSLNIYSVYSDRDVETPFLELIDYINENKHLPNGSDLRYWKHTGPSTYVSSGQFWYSEEQFVQNFIFDSNISLKLSSLTNLNGLKVGDAIYKENAVFPTYMSTQNYGKKIYTFNGNLNTLQNTKVKFYFDIPKDKMFNFEFNYSVTYPIGYDSPPYLEVISSSRRTVLPLLHKKEDLDQTIYYDTQINNFSSDVLNVNFVVDFDWFSEKTEEIFVHFDSEYPFSYEYITEDYYRTVDWSGNYGIMLLPKLSLNSGFYHDVYSDVFFKGKSLTLKIFPDDNTDINALEEHVFKNYNDFYGGYKYYFRSDSKKYKMFFVNSYYEYESNSTILKYDSRYFVHSICPSKEKCEVITNPNDVNDNVEVKPPDSFLSDEHKNSNETVDKILNFIYNKLPIIKQIPDVWGVFLLGIKDPQPPVFVVDLKDIGFDHKVYMDFSIFDQYRETIFFVIKLSATYITFKKILDILLKMFNE